MNNLREEKHLEDLLYQLVRNAFQIDKCVHQRVGSLYYLHKRKAILRKLEKEIGKEFDKEYLQRKLDMRFIF